METVSLCSTPVQTGRLQVCVHGKSCYFDFYQIDTVYSKEHFILFMHFSKFYDISKPVKHCIHCAHELRKLLKLWQPLHQWCNHYLSQ